MALTDLPPPPPPGHKRRWIDSDWFFGDYGWEEIPPWRPDEQARFLADLDASIAALTSRGTPSDSREESP